MNFPFSFLFFEGLPETATKHESAHVLLDARILSDPER